LLVLLYQSWVVYYQLATLSPYIPNLKDWGLRAFPSKGVLDGGGRIVAGDKFKDVARSIEIVDGVGLPIEKNLCTDQPLRKIVLLQLTILHASRPRTPDQLWAVLPNMYSAKPIFQRMAHPRRENWELTQNIFSVTLSNVQPFSFTLYVRGDNMKKISVEHTIWLAAPRERVWQAVTEPEQIAFGFGMMLENLQAYLLDTSLPYSYGF